MMDTLWVLSAWSWPLSSFGQWVLSSASFLSFKPAKRTHQRPSVSSALCSTFWASLLQSFWLQSPSLPTMAFKPAHKPAKTTPRQTRLQVMPRPTMSSRSQCSILPTSPPSKNTPTRHCLSYRLIPLPFRMGPTLPLAS